MQQFPYIAAIFVLGGIASAAVIAVDLRACRQPMRIMNSVWILTGLWAGFFGLGAYFAFGRTRRCTIAEKAMNTQSGIGGTGMGTGGAVEDSEMSRTKITDSVTRATAKGMEMHGTAGMTMDGMTDMPEMRMPGIRSGGTNGMEMDKMEMPERPRWQSVVLSTLHCGAGCTLADLVGEWFLFFVPVAIGGSMVAGSWVVDYLLALVFGIGFQYAAIRGMEPRTPRREVVRRAAKADILSLTAWQAGMYGWMAVVIFVLDDGTMLPRTSFRFWFTMQIAMACGFLLSLPVNVWLIRAGIKKGM